MSRLRVEAELLGYNKRWVWLRIPVNEGCTYKGLTMPRDFLPWGMATAEFVVLEYDPESLHHNGQGYVVDGEIVEMLDASGTTRGMAAEGPGAEG